jgi:hypothetical protein
MDQPHRTSSAPQAKDANPIALARLVAEVAAPPARPTAGHYNRTYNGHNR